MNIFRSISEGYKRARHTCGYGVHSPFAYRMVCRLRLSSGWGWYAERQLADCVHSSCRKGTCDATGGLADTLRFYRLCVDAGGDIFVDRDAPAPIRLAARLAAGSRYKVMTDVQRLDSCVAAWTQTTVISGAMAEAMARGSPATILSRSASRCFAAAVHIFFTRHSAAAGAAQLIALPPRWDAPGGLYRKLLSCTLP